MTWYLFSVFGVPRICTDPLVESFRRAIVHRLSVSQKICLKSSVRDLYSITSTLLDIPLKLHQMMRNQIVLTMYLNLHFFFGHYFYKCLVRSSHLLFRLLFVISYNAFMQIDVLACCESPPCQYTTARRTNLHAVRGRELPSWYNDRDWW